MESSQSRSGIKKLVSNRSPRSLTIVTLLALVPVALFALGRSLLAVVALVNVGLIFGSLYLLTAPTEAEQGRGGAHGHDEAHGEEHGHGEETTSHDETAEATGHESATDTSESAH
ncbi:hypothetical protein [Halorussus ruber]|uniref:hypothetical protein n=1 Tax=Halorussus ruber TaxID=1126238 RepID=UPI001B2FF60F|nr:hypothetical protein [Halorussus ruber]